MRGKLFHCNVHKFLHKICSFTVKFKPWLKILFKPNKNNLTNKAKWNNPGNIDIS